MFEYVLEFFTNHYTTCIVILGTCLVGITAGALGAFALLRKQSLLGDAISHAALPGIALAFLATYSKNPLVLLCGGSLAGALGTLLTMLITRTTRLKIDTALGIILSVFFGFGLVLMTHIQKRPIADQAILNKFIFGNASTLLVQDIYVIAGISFLVLTCLIFFWKQFTIVSFDESFAHTLGFSVLLIDSLLTALLILTICAGLQTIGVILMSSMLIAPAAAARQWTQRLRSMVLLAALLGSTAALSGSLLSSAIDHMPTGPTIVLMLSLFVGISLVAAPRRGAA